MIWAETPAEIAHAADRWLKGGGSVISARGSNTVKICGPLCEKTGQNVIELTAIGTVGRILKISIKILHSKGCFEAFCEWVKTIHLKVICRIGGKCRAAPAAGMQLHT